MKYLGKKEQDRDIAVFSDLQGKEVSGEWVNMYNQGKYGYANAAYNGGVRPYFCIKGH